ncbi:L-xylulose reductase [Lasiodiplodia hormozganensis]|uniref:L-xylulose reductase n=1 Tax=Lasiodiplodia hormozganensis TaxID=869390 RepID=A0AA39YJP7_9PEZI|nr:L-xylulose reductase [Lasiodiplodia hormozganensis]
MHPTELLWDRGIGAGIALDLGRRGADVVVNYTSEKSGAAAESIVQAIESMKLGARALAVRADVAVAADRQRLVDAALTLSPSKHIDMLVHNAGNGDDRYLVDLDEDFFDMQMDLNLKAPVFLTQIALPHMPRGGRIVIISSVSARMGVPQQSIYAASKVGTEALARVWATELGQSRGITVNCVNPGPVATDMYYASSQEFIDALKPLIDSTPAEARMGEVADIVPLVR